MATKRGLHKSSVRPLLLSGPGAAKGLIKRLNDGPNGEVEALRRLVRNFNEIDDIARGRGFPEVNYTRREFPPPEVHVDVDLPFVRRMREIQAAYKSYRAVPWPAYPQKDGWKFHWLQPWSTQSNKSVERWIYLAIIHDLAVDGHLRLVRECDFCHRWFFARKSDQRFCTDGSCREKDWRTSAAGRAKRAAYMRGYRQREERARQNALKAANETRVDHRSNRK